MALLLFATAAVALFLATAPDPEPDGPAGRELAAAGPHSVRELELSLLDASRPTPPIEGVPGSPERALTTTVWLPADDGARALPLIVYSHGFMGSREENARLCAHLAGRGFVVAAADFPRTSYDAPGEPDMSDLPQQPRDVRFVIDALLERSADPASPLHRRLDGERIGVMGLSLGGLTTALVAFHPRLRDPRVRAAVSIAGPTSMFSRGFFETAPLPFLMVAGDIDAIVDYPSNARPVLERVPGGRLLTLEGGSHVGFTDVAASIFRWLDNPDSVGCDGLEGRTPTDGVGWPELGDASDGIIAEPPNPLPCTRLPLPRAMRPARQQMLTRIAVTAFLEARLRDGVGDLPRLRAVAVEHPDATLEVADPGGAP